MRGEPVAHLPCGIAEMEGVCSLGDAKAKLLHSMFARRGHKVRVAEELARLVVPPDGTGRLHNTQSTQCAADTCQHSVGIGSVGKEAFAVFADSSEREISLLLDPICHAGLAPMG